MLFPVPPGHPLQARLWAGKVCVYLTKGDACCFPTTEVNKNSHYPLFLVKSEANCKGTTAPGGQSHILVTRSFHGGGQYLRSSEFQTPFNRQRGKVNKILNTFTICQISRILSTMPARFWEKAVQSPESCQVLGNLVLCKRHGNLATKYLSY